MCPALPQAPGPRGWASAVPEFDAQELEALCGWLLQEEAAAGAPCSAHSPTGRQALLSCHAVQRWLRASSHRAEQAAVAPLSLETRSATLAGAAAPAGRQPELSAGPAQGPCGLGAVNLRCRTTPPSPFAQPELQSATPCGAATPAPASRRSSSHSRGAHVPLRSIDFRSLAPKRAIVAAPEQPQPQQQRAASCAGVPRVQPQFVVPRAASAGAAALPAVTAPVPVAPAPDSALAWVTGFSSLAKTLGCAAPAASGCLWDPPEASDLLVLLTLELR